MTNQPASTPPAEYALQQALLNLLTTLPETLVRGVLLSAVPHWFDEALLAQLIGDAGQTGALLEELDDLHFIQRDVSGQLYTYQPAIRDILLHELRQKHADQFNAANRVALAYFQELAGSAPAQDIPALQQQVIFHQFNVDEAAGLDLLRSCFEEAYDRRQLGNAEDYLTQAGELTATLSDESRAWLEYFTARLELASRKDRSGEAVFQDLAARAQNPLLRALAGWSLGQIHLNRHQWTRAIKHFKAALAAVKGEPSGLYLARVQLSIGDAYLDLAQNSGGLEIASWRPQSRLRRLFQIIANLPFLIIEWLLRRVSWLPDGWYAGANYQDWIILYLLDRASRWYRRARKQFQHNRDPRGQVDALLPLAKIEFMKNRWSRAEKNYRALLKKEPVTASPYRMARVQLGLAELYNQQGKPENAARAARQALETFQRYRSQALSAAAADQLGQADYHLGNLYMAGRAFLTSLSEYRQAGEALKATQVTWELERLAAEPKIPLPTRQQIVEALAQTPNRAYLQRFPDGLLRWFRKIAVWGALPMAFVLILGLGILLFMASLMIESQFVLYFAGSSLALPVSFLAYCILLLLIALWFYHLSYSLIGMLAVRLLGRRLADIENGQPQHIETHPDRLILRHQDVETDDTWPWIEIDQFNGVNYLIWNRPIRLLSRILLSVKNSRIILEGSTRGYPHLHDDVAHRLVSTKPQHQYDFIFLRSVWTIIALLISFGSAIYAKANGWWIDTEVQAAIAPHMGPPQTILINHDLFFSSVFLFAYLQMLFSFSSVTLWRLAFFHRKCEKIPGGRVGMVPDWVIWIGAIFSTMMVIGFLLFIQFVSI